MLASTIQFTTNPPTPSPTTHTGQQNTGQATRAHCPRTPTACHPHAHQARGGTHHQPTTTTTTAAAAHQSGCVSYASTRQANHPAHQCTTVSHPAFREEQPPAGPDPFSGPDNNDQEATPHTTSILRKEVIQPHLPVRLPCYDFVPITSPTFDRSP